MDIGIGFPNMVRSLDRKTVLEWAVRAEEADFASLSTGERLSFDMNDVFIELGMAAAVTERIRLLSSVVVLPLHTTAVVAKQAATLGHLSGGRFQLGVGSGGHPPDYDAAPVPWNRRIGRFEHQLAEIQALWRGEPMGPSGAVLGPRPEPGSLPLLIGPSTPKAAARAHLADGLITFFWEKDTAPQEALFDVACQSWTDNGRAGRPRWVAGLFFAVGPDARDRADVTLRAYYESFADSMDEVVAMLEAIQTTSDAAVRDAIKRFADSGADELILCPLIPDLEQIDRLRDLC